jgi:hypothetical protein
MDAVIARAGFTVDEVTEAARKKLRGGGPENCSLALPEAHRSAPPGQEEGQG